MQTQETTAKKSYTKKFRPKKSKPIKGKTFILLRLKSTEPGKTFYIDRKKKYFIKKRNQKNSTLQLEITLTPLKIVNKNKIIKVMKSATIVRNKVIF